MVHSSKKLRGLMAKPGIPAVLALAVLVSAAGGAAAVAFVMDPPTPPALSPVEAIQTVDVEDVEYRDSRQVHLSLVQSETILVTSQTPGRVTSLNCVPGGYLNSGTVPIAVDALPLLALATAVPLYRDIVPGDVGADVDALLSELERLGTGIIAGGPLGQDALDVLAMLMFDAGYPLETLQSVPYERILWLPSPSSGVSTCDVQLGQVLEPAEPIATVPGNLTAASAVTSNIDNVLEGSRLLSIGGLEFVVDETNRISDAEQLSAISRLPGFAAALKKDDPVPLEAQWLLAEPIQAASVPAASLYGIKSGAACVLGEKGGVAVEILGSQLGQTLIRADGQDTPKKVHLKPPKDADVC